MTTHIKKSPEIRGTIASFDLAVAVTDVALKPGETVLFSMHRLVGLFRPLRLVLAGALEPLEVIEIAVGAETVMQGGPVCASIFASNAPDPAIAFPVMAPGINLLVRIRNRSDHKAIVKATVQGVEVYEGSYLRADGAQA